MGEWVVSDGQGAGQPGGLTKLVGTGAGPRVVRVGTVRGQGRVQPERTPARAPVLRQGAHVTMKDTAGLCPQCPGCAC